MQKTKNNVVRKGVYQLLMKNSDFKVPPVQVEQARTLKLDFNRRMVVNPRMRVAPMFVS